MKQSFFSQIEHDKEDIIRLNNALYQLDSLDKLYEEIKVPADNHTLKYEHCVKDESQLFSSKVSGTAKETCVMIARIEKTDNSVLKWKQSMILSMCMNVMLAFNSNAESLPFCVELFIVTKDDEISLMSEKTFQDAKFCIFFDWGNELRNSMTSSAVIKNTFVFSSKTIPLDSQFYYGNPLLCLSCFEAVCTDISSCLSKGAVIRLIPEKVEKNDFFKITSLSIGSYTITSDISLAEEISAILSAMAVSIAQSCIVELESDIKTMIEMPFQADKKINKIFMHSFKENGFIKAHSPKSIQNVISAAQISCKIPSIMPCIGLIDTTKEEDIAYRTNEHAISEQAANSLICASKAVVSAICDMFQFNGN